MDTTGLQVRSEIRDAINSEVGTARARRAEAEALIAGGAAPDSAEVLEKIEAAETAIARSESHMRRAEIEAQEAAAAAWSARTVGDAAPPRVHSDIWAQDEEERAQDPTATPEYRRAFARYATRYGVRGDRFEESERRVLRVAVDADGGYTVPADDRAEILRRIPAISRLLQFVTSFPTTRDIVEWTRVQPNASQGSIYTSAFVGTMVGETPGGNDGAAEPKFGKFNINMKKGRSKALVSRDLAADSEIDMMGFLTGDGAINAALLRESQIVNGSGIGNNVKGIVSYNGGTSNTDPDKITAIDIEGSTANTISNTTAATGSAPKLLDLVYGVPEQYAASPSFRVVYNRQTAKKFRKLVDGNGAFIWAAGFVGEPDLLLGAPTVVSAFMPDDGTDGNVPVLAGALDQLIVPVRAEITAQILLERYADEDEIGLFLRQRFGLGVSNTDAFRFGAV